jgi:hypothetical protein
VRRMRLCGLHRMIPATPSDTSYVDVLRMKGTCLAEMRNESGDGGDLVRIC